MTSTINMFVEIFFESQKTINVLMAGTSSIFHFLSRKTYVLG